MGGRAAATVVNELRHWVREAFSVVGEEVVPFAVAIERPTSFVKDCEPSNWSMPME